MAIIDTDDLDQELMQTVDYIKKNTICINNYNVFLDESIGDSKNYRELRHLLYSISENDRVTIFLNNTGGQLHTALAIVEAMQRCQAKIHCVVEGECMSAATIIMLNSHEITITDSSVIMCHSMAHGVIGTSLNVKTQAEFADKYWKNLEKRAYTGFLTEKEISEMDLGKEFLFDANEARKRLKKWAELKNKG
jgi:ATP-dependent protease ClpP protease subunit